MEMELRKQPLSMVKICTTNYDQIKEGRFRKELQKISDSVSLRFAPLLQEARQREQSMGVNVMRLKDDAQKFLEEKDKFDTMR
jgi:hypothetical protein